MNRILLASCYLLSQLMSLPAQAQTQTLVVGGSGADLGTFALLAEAFSKTHSGIEIKVLPSMGSSGGMKALSHDRLDLALTSRALKLTEQSADIQAVHYASTPLVFSVSNLSAQNDISREQVNQIYAGELRQWPDGSVLRPILRPTKDSDTQILIETLAECKPCFHQIYQRRGVPVALTDQESSSMIARVPGAIGTSTLALILSENKPIKALKLDGVKPSVETLANRTYPLYKDLYFSYKKKLRNKNLQAFIDFISTETGQLILLNTGHKIIR